MINDLDRKEMVDRGPAGPWTWLAPVATSLTILVRLLFPEGGSAILRYTALPLLLVAAVFMFVPFLLLSRHGERSGASYMETSVVVDRGLYAVTRHPQYLGYILLGWGFALQSQHWLTITLAILATISFYRLSELEERICAVHFGEPYHLYIERVPRFNAVLGAWRLLSGRSDSGTCDL